MQHSNNINIEDLLSDEHFISWIKHPNKDRDLYWKWWLEAHPARKSDVLLAREILIRSQFRQTSPSQEAYTEVLHRLMKKETNHGPLAHRHTYPHLRFWDYRVRVAASWVLVALVFALMVWWLADSVDPQRPPVASAWIIKHNPSGIKSKLQLPDGTMVWLNAESTLKYPQAFEATARQVVLEGEAFFEVEKDVKRPFIVQSGNVSTKALGTSFNISSYLQEETIEVSLVTGKVAVSKTKGEAREKMILAPGEQVIYSGYEQDFIKTTFDYDSSVGWKDGLLLFREADLEQIKRKLERWYGVQIKIIGTPAQPWKINGAFRHQSLERVLERLAFSKDFTFQISETKVIIDLIHKKAP